MKILRVKVVPGSPRDSVKVGVDGRLMITVRARRERGLANERMRELIAHYFGIPQRAVHLRSGHFASTKTIIVDGL